MTSTKPSYFESAMQTGLSAKAAAVYVALLEAGSPLAPKNIISRSNLYRQYVYDGLRELEEKRLIATTGEGRRIKYLAASPDRLLQEAERARVDALEGVQQLMRVYDRSPAGVVEIARGSQAAIEKDFRLAREARQGDSLDIIGGGGMHWVHLMQNSGRMEEFEQVRREKDLKIRYIGTGEDVRYNYEKSTMENESRIIPGIGSVITTTILPDRVTFNIYEPEVMYVEVRHPAAVASQRAIFEILWTVAEPYR